MRTQTLSFHPFEYQASLSEYDIKAALGSSSSLPHKIFLPDVHEIDIRNDDCFLQPNLRLLCRPYGEGKSTELSYIRVLFESLETPLSKRAFFAKFDRTWRSRPRSDLFGYLQLIFEVEKARTFEQLVSGLPSKSLSLLLLDNIENLSDDSISWLVGSIHALEEKYDLLGLSQQIHVVVAGSFGMGQLSRELFSIFYTDELPFKIRDYADHHIDSIASRLDRMLSVNVTPELGREVRQFAGGEKRVVNMFFDLTLEAAAGEANFLMGRELTKKHFDDACRYYFDLEFRKDGRMQRTLRAVLTEDRAVMFLRRLRAREFLHWDAVPPDVHKILYNYGLVTIEGGDAFFRSPFVERVISMALDNVKRATAFLGEYLGRDSTVPAGDRASRISLAKELRGGSFQGSVLWVFYGEVLGVTGDEAEVELKDWDGNAFVVRLALSELGGRFPPGTGFLRYKILTEEGPQEKWFFYEPSNDRDRNTTQEAVD